ncbi:MAG: DNA recombination protein RmuC [Chloroflexota bacterium]
MSGETLFLAVGVALVLAVVLLLGAILVYLIWQSRKPTEPSALDLLQRQIFQMNQELRELRQEQATVPTTLAEGQAKNLEALQANFTAIVATLNEQLSRTQTNIAQQLDSSSTLMGEVKERLGELSETARVIQELGKDISSLQDILRAPKLRGGIGELFLEDLLKQSLPSGNYQIQHAFRSGERVDAAIRLGDRLVPVDSKFPLEGFNRLMASQSEEEKKRARKEFAASVKKQISDIAEKYIRPDEGTYDFALMYIPAENVFYEVIVKDEILGEEKGLSTYALERRVVPVSPSSFYAYLMAIAYGLRGMHIEKQAQEIRDRLGELQQRFGRFYDVFVDLGRSLNAAARKYEDAHKRAERFNEKMSLVTGTALELAEAPEVSRLALEGAKEEKAEG